MYHATMPESCMYHSGLRIAGRSLTHTATVVEQLTTVEMITIAVLIFRVVQVIFTILQG